ncbi:MAG TPA: hypothetical protein VHE60_18445 [Pyrinomonadaceae bacterium]|nr:hypothetical protein [Pyrinomonadaceae bacterium]
MKESLAVAIVKIILGVALVGGMFVAGWNVYRRLPSDGSVAMNITAADSRAETRLTVMLRSEITGATLNSPVDIYPFDLVAAQREFQATPHLARQFDDFLLRRMHGITPVKATTDNTGRAVAILSEGNWWLHATASLSGGETIEWRLPVNVASREQTVELTMENAYERTKKF